MISPLQLTVYSLMLSEVSFSSNKTRVCYGVHTWFINFIYNAEKTQEQIKLNII